MTLQLLKPSFRVKDASHNLVVVTELVDAGCGVYFHSTGFDLEYNGEIIYRGRRDAESKLRLWKMSLIDDRTSRIVPEFEPNLEDPCNGFIMQDVQKHYHASFGSHTRHKLYTAAKAGYLQECPGLTPPCSSGVTETLSTLLTTSFFSKK